VIVGDSNGCVNSASKYVLITGIGEMESENLFAVFPNPSIGSFNIELKDGILNGEVLIDVLNTLGQKIYCFKENLSSASFKKEIELENISEGVYIVEIISESSYYREKIIITK
jgi:hypothetical protein